MLLKLLIYKKTSWHFKQLYIIQNVIKTYFIWNYKHFFFISMKGEFHHFFLQVKMGYFVPTFDGWNIDAILLAHSLCLISINHSSKLITGVGNSKIFNISKLKPEFFFNKEITRNNLQKGNWKNLKKLWSKNIFRILTFFQHKKTKINNLKVN